MPTASIISVLRCVWQQGDDDYRHDDDQIARRHGARCNFRTASKPGLENRKGARELTFIASTLRLSALVEDVHREPPIENVLTIAARKERSGGRMCDPGRRAKDVMIGIGTASSYPTLRFVPQCMPLKGLLNRPD